MPNQQRSVAEAIATARDKYAIPQHLKPEDIPENLLDILALSVAVDPSAPAFTCLGITLSYGDLDNLSDQFAAYLQNMARLQRGDRVAIQLPNILQYPVVAFGILKAGLIIVNVNPLYTERELTLQLNDSCAKVLVVLDSLMQNSVAALASSNVELLISTGVADLASPVKRFVMNSVIKLVGKGRKLAVQEKEMSMRDVISQGRALTLHPVHLQASDTAVLQYTGGTTGRSKGAVLSQGNLAVNTYQAQAILVKAGLQEGKEVVICPLPLYHIFAFVAGMAVMIRLRCHIYLIPDPRDIKALIKVMKNSKVSIFFGLNTLFSALLRDESFHDADFSSLRLTGSGGTALSDDIAQKWQASTGCTITEGYGLTETSPVATLNIPGHETLGAVGVAVSESEIQIVDNEGVLQAVGGEGEIWIRGPHVMQGYWNNEEETRKAITEDGWFKTGDIGSVTEDGSLRILDRQKDMVIVSGFNVYPNEIENVVNSHPAVLESAVIGIPDTKTGEAVKLFVVCGDPPATKEELISWCRTQLTAYKVPRSIEFKDELPKSNVGKVLRKMLRD